MNTRFDPELYAMGIEIVVYHIERGTRPFADLSKAIISDLGIEIKPYLKSY